MTTCSTSVGGLTSSLSAAPAKSSMYTWKYRGASCAGSPGIPPSRCRCVRLSAQRCTAAGYGCR
eukprot:4658476-Pleurochrysis_carterae.AAC.1